MKKTLSLIALLSCITFSFAQVGIGTTEPKATLDIDGNLRVRGLKDNLNVTEAVRILGIDEEGNFVEVEVDENIILEDNKLRAVERRYRFATTEIVYQGTVHNLNLVILPGEPNDDKKIMRILTSGSSVDITGLLAGEDGQTVWLYPVNGKIKLLGSNNGSDPENQFLLNNTITIFQYEMIQLVYDGILQKWIVMDN